MRVFYIIILFAVAVLPLPAQPNTTTDAAANTVDATNSPSSSKQVRGPIVIQSLGPAIFDQNQHVVTYSDHVQVTDPQMKMTCEWLEAILPQQHSQHLTNIVAETNVVIDFTDAGGHVTHATGDKAVYFFHVQDGVTNETVTLTGNPPKVQMGPYSTTGESIVWDRTTGKFWVNKPTAVAQPGTNGFGNFPGINNSK